MTDEELGRQILDAALFTQGWSTQTSINAGKAARALLAAERVGLPSREDAALKIAAALYPNVSWNCLMEPDRRGCLRAADLALSWHAPEPVEQDVERLAEWLWDICEDEEPKTNLGWKNAAPWNAAALRALARALIARYGTPPEAIEQVREMQVALGKLKTECEYLQAKLTDKGRGPSVSQEGDVAATASPSALTDESARLRSALEGAKASIKSICDGTERKSPAWALDAIINTITAALAPSPAEAKVAEGGEQPEEVAYFARSSVPVDWQVISFIGNQGGVLCKRRRAGGGL